MDRKDHFILLGFTTKLCQIPVKNGDHLRNRRRELPTPYMPLKQLITHATNTYLLTQNKKEKSGRYWRINLIVMMNAAWTVQLSFADIIPHK